MKEYTGRILTNDFIFMGTKLSKEALKELEKTQPKLYVTHEFGNEVIGHADGIEIDDAGVIADIHLIEPDPVLKFPTRPYAVPAFYFRETDYHMDGDIKVIDHAEFFLISLVAVPADKMLTPIQPKEK